MNLFTLQCCTAMPMREQSALLVARMGCCHAYVRQKGGTVGFSCVRAPWARRGGPTLLFWSGMMANSESLGSPQARASSCSTSSALDVSELHQDRKVAADEGLKVEDQAQPPRLTSQPVEPTQQCVRVE